MCKVHLIPLLLYQRSSEVRKSDSESFKLTQKDSFLECDNEDLSSEDSLSEKMLKSVMSWFENKGVKKGDPDQLREELREAK